jgi:hypothetical protein
MRMVQSNTIQHLKAKLRQVLLTANPHGRPETLIRLSLLRGAYFEQTAHQMYSAAVSGAVDAQSLR